MKINKWRIILAFVLMIGFSGPTVFAITIENNISSEASTGGNNSNNGNVIQGKARSEVFIETIVDGEVVNLVDEKVEDLESAVIKKEINYVNQDSKIQTEISADVKSTTKVTNQEILDENKKVEEENLGEILGEKKTNATSTEEKKEKESIIIGFLKKILSYVFNFF